MGAPVVLITGALTGIGRATALAFGREGARIVVSGRRDDLGVAFARNSKSAAIEGATAGIRVNAVAPGPVETEMLNRIAGGADKTAALADGVPARRLGTPEEIAATIVFLASDKADFITGQIISVNGGKTAL